MQISFAQRRRPINKPDRSGLFIGSVFAAAGAAAGCLPARQVFLSHSDEARQQCPVAAPAVAKTLTINKLLDQSVFYRTAQLRKARLSEYTKLCKWTDLPRTGHEALICIRLHFLIDSPPNVPPRKSESVLFFQFHIRSPGNI